MILADTSVWINHFRRPDLHLRWLLKRNELLMHPFVAGELAVGNLANRARSLKMLGDLPKSKIVPHDDVILLIGVHALHGTGLGFIDAHLLAAVQLSPGTQLWTCDKRLHDAAARLGVSF
jgi:predicted nucleic acid-binding protein